MTEQDQQDSTQDAPKSVEVFFDRTVTSSDGQHYRFSGNSDGLVLIHRDNVEVYRASMPVEEVWLYVGYARAIVEATKNIADQYIAADVPGIIKRRQAVQEILGYTQAEARQKAAEAAAIYKSNPATMQEVLAVAQFWATMAITAPLSRAHTSRPHTYQPPTGLSPSDAP